MNRVRKGFDTTVLGFSEAEDDGVIEHVCDKMKAGSTSHRVTFRCLMAEAGGKAAVLA